MVRSLRRPLSRPSLAVAGADVLFFVLVWVTKTI